MSKKKKTLAQKKKDNPNKPKGKSKYALKVEARRRLARKLGQADAPLPVLSQEETLIEEDDNEKA